MWLRLVAQHSWRRKNVLRRYFKMWSLFSPLKQIADSWSAYVKTPTKASSDKIAPKSAQEPAIHAKTEQTSATAHPGRLLSSLTTSLGGWVFHSQDEELNQVNIGKYNVIILLTVTRQSFDELLEH